MSIDDLIKDIPTQPSFDDIPDSFEGKVTKLETTAKKQGTDAGKKQISITIEIKDFGAFTTSYRIPKTMTGNGQLDELLNSLAMLDLSKVSDMLNKTFKWERKSIGMGNPRHYPVLLVK